MNASDSAERPAIAFYGATVLVIELLLVAAVRHVGSQPDLLVEPSEAEALPTRRQHERRGWFRSLTYPVAIAYLVVAAEGVLLLGGKSRFSLRRLLSRA
ncbi:MAG: hypothetical protein ACXVVQ_07435 [Solirubrobacteraceae bacterium]